MKISVSIRDSDAVFLDDYGRSHGIASRSAVLQRAIILLRASDLSEHYESAFTEWTGDGEADVWDATVADGLSSSR